MPTKTLDQQVLQQLQHAIEADAPALLKPLIDAGVSVNQKIGDYPQTTLLELAIEINAIEVVTFLITAEANLDKGSFKPLIHAALFNRTEIVRRLLKAGANPDVTHSNRDEDERGLTALMYAVDLPEKIEIVKILLKYNANPHAATSKGNTALYDAVDRGNIEAVKLLLQAGSKPSGPILNGPVFRGTKDSLEMVKVLLTAGADLKVRGTREACLEGRTALEGAREQYEEKNKLIRELERRERKNWEDKILERWKSEAQIYQEMIHELTEAKTGSNGKTAS